MESEPWSIFLPDLVINFLFNFKYDNIIKTNKNYNIIISLCKNGLLIIMGCKILMEKKSVKKELNAYFKQEGFMVEIIPYEQTDISDINKEDDLKEWMLRFKEDKYRALFHLGFLIEQEWFSPSVKYLYSISDMLISRLSKQPDIEFAREAIEIELDEDEVSSLIEDLPFAIGMEYVNIIWINSLWARLLDIFREEIKNYKDTVAKYFAEYNSNINIVGRVFFHLVENKDEEYPFAFMATYSTKPPKSKKAIHTPLKNALIEFKDDQKGLLSLLATITRVGEESRLISQLMEGGELFYPLKFTIEEAYMFLTEITLYESAGIMCRIPDWWRKKNNRINISISVGEKQPSTVGLDAIMDFSPQLTMGEESLSEKELREFLNMAEGLVQYKGKWVEINKEKLGTVLDAFTKAKELAKNEPITLGEAMRMELNIDKSLNISTEDVEIKITNGQWLREKIKDLINPGLVQEIDLVPSLNVTFRNYQKVGYNWLYMMSQMGLGACLADDMGLGKTVQVIGFLEYVRVKHGGKTLLILPASLIGNWQKEVERFAPDLNYEILHKSAVKGQKEIIISNSSFLYITSYGMVSRLEELKSIKWDIIILDEAQAIKNPGTKQTKRIKEIQAKMKIAMTGTPIENRLSDLWSLFDFLNKGLLGTGKEFTKFTKDIGDNAFVYGKLRKMIQPFILRRLKTDKTIISDLPDKLEINEYPSLTKRQIGLYQKLLDKISHQLIKAEGIQRKGLVLSSIMKFKQICNHPDQYLGKEEYKADHSGKFKQLGLICETIYEKREKVLIFTQFKEMTEPISDFLKGIFHNEGLILHGTTPVKKRTQMVEEFNGDSYIPYMVLSLKAGGVGLNLIGANHVIHFDRWWNPAVENQATDRAFRIGQTKNVMVHKFITKGTIEEKIDQMIEKKQKLAKDILSTSGEQWITELDNKELLQLFSLGGD